MQTQKVQFESNQLIYKYICNLISIQETNRVSASEQSDVSSFLPRVMILVNLKHLLLGRSGSFALR